MTEAPKQEDDDSAFWLAASESALDEIWNHPEDDVYAELLNQQEQPKEAKDDEQ